MRSWTGLFAQVATRAHLAQACEAAARGKRRVPEVAAFLFEREQRLKQLLLELYQHQYRPQPFRTFLVRDPKPRIITCAPFRDRVVHHALVGVLQPCFEPSFVGDSFACQSGRGTHRAVLRHQHLMRHHRFVMTVDIRKYFLSIPHARLIALLSAQLRDPDLLWLIACLISHERGLYLQPELVATLGDTRFVPREDCGIAIGTLTSQFYGNLYLNPLDHFIKRELKVEGFIRYMDNCSLFADSRAQLTQWLRRVERFVEERLGLSLTPRSGRIIPCTARVEYLGYRVSRTERVPGKRMLKRLKHRLLGWRNSTLDPRTLESIRRSLASSRGLLQG